MGDGGKLTSCHMFPGCKVKVGLLLLITQRCHSESHNGTNGETAGRYNFTVVFVNRMLGCLFFFAEHSLMTAVNFFIGLRLEVTETIEEKFSFYVHI